MLAAQGGEIPYEAFEELLHGMIAHFDSTGELNRAPLTLLPEGANTPDTLLAYPGKILVDEASARIFIADSSHHRIVIAQLETFEILDVIGSGQAGYQDGNFEEARFNTPQGMALRDDTLYIADTNNHAIRTADLTRRVVDTLAGTGVMGQGMTQFGAQIREPRAFTLRSPWDVELGANDTLFIAMAGTHQIWEMNLNTKVLRVSVGNGREALLNDSLENSELAQPSGLYFDDGLLYFADSESSSIRVADYTNNIVRTIAGPNENTLFDYGDIDGTVGASRLQHALGLTGTSDGTIYIADTYNSKIKMIDQTTRTTTLFGAEGGFCDGDANQARFDEPGGVDYADGKLYVADTNNHAVRIIDLESQQVRTVTFPNPRRLVADAGIITVIGGQPHTGESVTLPEQALSAGAGTLRLELKLPAGYKLNLSAPGVIRWRFDDGEIETQTLIEPVTEIPIILATGETKVHVEIAAYYCEEQDEQLCYIEAVKFVLPVSIGPAGGFETTAAIRHTITPSVTLTGDIKRIE